MKTFSELNINVHMKNFIGNQIKIYNVFNKEIEIHSYKTEPSKKNQSILLTIQIKIDNEFRVIFCGSRNLEAILNQVDKSDFPFKCKIINQNSTYILN